MKLSHCATIHFYILLNIAFTCAKINGGPRGRFSKDFDRKPTVNHHVSARHAHFSYHPPSHISFVCRYCSHPHAYPVYHGQPPSYVYKYRESGSRFGDLLTGLALYNLGRSALDHGHTSHYHEQRIDEVCSLQVIDPNRFEETSIPCFMISSFMDKSERIPVGESHTVDIMGSHIEVKSFIESTGMPPIEVTRNQECVIWHNATVHKERNNIQCALLKKYANTMKPSGVPVYIWLPVTVSVVVTISICCQVGCKKRKEFKEIAPLNDTQVIGYCSNCK